MAKKTERTSKPVKAVKGDRWTVRGVPPRLQKAAGDSARARGMTLGQWLSDVLAKVTIGAPAPASDAARGGSLEQRLARLEAQVFGAEAPMPPPGTRAGGEQRSIA